MLLFCKLVGVLIVISKMPYKWQNTGDNYHNNNNKV